MRSSALLSKSLHSLTRTTRILDQKPPATHLTSASGERATNDPAAQIDADKCGSATGGSATAGSAGSADGGSVTNQAGAGGTSTGGDATGGAGSIGTGGGGAFQVLVIQVQAEVR